MYCHVFFCFNSGIGIRSSKIIDSQSTKLNSFIISHPFLHSFFVVLPFSDDLLSLPEFMLICRALFRNDKGHIYVVSDEKLEQIFEVFDKNEDGFIDRNEFQFCWNHWIKTV